MVVDHLAIIFTSPLTSCLETGFLAAVWLFCMFLFYIQRVPSNDDDDLSTDE